MMPATMPGVYDDTAMKTYLPVLITIPRRQGMLYQPIRHFPAMTLTHSPPGKAHAIKPPPSRPDITTAAHYYVIIMPPY